MTLMPSLQGRYLLLGSGCWEPVACSGSPLTRRVGKINPSPWLQKAMGVGGGGRVRVRVRLRHIMYIYNPIQSSQTLCHCILFGKWTAFIKRFYPKHVTTLTSGADRVRCLAQGHLDAQLVEILTPFATLRQTPCCFTQETI